MAKVRPPPQGALQRLPPLAAPIAINRSFVSDQRGTAPSSQQLHTLQGGLKPADESRTSSHGQGLFTSCLHVVCVLNLAERQATERLQATRHRRR